jgi:acetyl esterase/lipase
MNQLKISTVSFLAVPAFVSLLASCAPAQTAMPANANWKMAPISPQTQWAKEVSPANALPAYPRPQMTAPTGNRSTAPVEPPVSTAPVEPPPTFDAVAYGQLPKQVLTFWQAKSDKPTPWLFHIHGGGWTSQQRIFGLVTVPGFVQDMLDHGISVVTVEYRLLDEAAADGLNPPVKGPMLDCARALQFVRSKAKEWNLDKKRVALCGDSAGGCTALWLAFHKDLANPKSRDLVARESTRPLCVAVQHPQTTLDPQQMREWIPKLEYGDQAFGIKADLTAKKSSFEVFLAEREKLLPLINKLSPYALVTRNAPPVFMFYYTAPVFDQSQQDVHSANFGAKLQEKCQRLGVECELVYPGAPGVVEANPYHKIYFEKYFLEKLLGGK